MQREAVAANEDLGKDLEHVEVLAYSHVHNVLIFRIMYWLYYVQPLSH